MLFFFSSRRRHTMSLCDWSSDVCSSDLSSASSTELRASVDDAEDRPAVCTLCSVTPAAAAAFARSEERRVGKECRSRGFADDYKKIAHKSGVTEQSNI